MIRKTVRLLTAVCMGVILILGPAVFAVGAAVPVVQDNANILTAEQESEIEQLGIRLFDATSAELSVLTLPSIGDEPVEQFAVEKLREFELGDKKLNNGALLVVTTERNSSGDRHFYLTVGYGLEGALPDGKIGRIMDEVAYPYLEEEQADSAIMEAYKAYYNAIAAEYGLEGEELPVNTVHGAYDDDEGFPFIFIIIFAIILFSIFSKRGGGRGGGSGGSRRGGGPIFIPGGFGGSSGGSGGGFGGFGGGGSGGGGGAGRSW